MKKIIGIILVFALLLAVLSAFSACKAGGTSVAIKNLGNYTIVYPESWEDWQKEDVDLLAEVIGRVTNKTVKVVTDKTAVDGNVIAMGSSSVNITCAEKSALKSEMDYVIAVVNGDIVLGGETYYSDMRAIYDFINNYLGYDDLTDTYDTAKEKVEGVNVVTYNEPAFTVLANDNGKYPFRTVADAKTMADAGFNAVRLETAKIDTDLYHEYGKWCARYGIRIYQRIVYNIKTEEFTINDIDYSVSNPMFKGHIVKYESDLGADDMYTKMTKNYTANYASYGWKVAVELPVFSPFAENNYKAAFDGGFIEDADIIIVRIDIGVDKDERKMTKLDRLSEVAEYAKKIGAELWSVVELNENGVESNPKLFSWRAYVGLSFGATGVTFANYRRSVVVTDDFEKTDGFKQASAMAKEIVSTYDLIKDYKYLGTYTTNEQLLDKFTNMSNPYVGFADSVSITDDFGTNSPLVVGCYEAEDGRKAIIITNVTKLDDLSYDSTVSMPITVDAKDENAKLYIGGVQDNDVGGGTGKSVMIVNGRGGLFLFE